MTKLTDEDLRAIRARAEAATPGPWTVEHEMKYDVNESTAYLSELHLVGKKETVKIYCGPGHAAPQVYDLVFLAHARADIPALLAHIRAQDAELARLRDALAALVSTRDDDGSETWFVKAPQGGVRCICCGEDFAYVGKFHHAPDCPIAAARRALEGGADETPLDYGLARGWQSYHEEYTDALGFLPCDGFGTKVYVVRDKEGRLMGFSQVSRQDAFQDAYEKAKRALEGGA
jgi:hypothetical protein